MNAGQVGEQMIQIETATQFCAWGSAGPEHLAGQRDRKPGESGGRPATLQDLWRRGASD